MTRKKLYFDATPLINKYMSGVGKVLLETLHALDTPYYAEEYDIYMFVPFDEVKKLQEFSFRFIKTEVLPYPHKFLSFFSRTAIAPPLDLFLGKGIYIFPNFRNWPLLYSRSVTYIHDVSFMVYPEYVEQKNLSYLQKNVGRWIKRTDSVVTVSTHAKTEIERYFIEARGKTTVVHNGVSPDFVPQPKGAVSAAAKKYGITPKEYFMFLSNIEPRKNIAGLLDAYELFIGQAGNDNVQLLLVGGMGWNNGDIYQRIAAINKHKKRVILPSDYVPDGDLPALISGAAALVHPAHYEGFGISPLQAMACGTQVVVANNTSLPEVIGDGGIYINESDAKDILRGMEVAYNKRYDVNEKGIKRAREFTWESSARQLAKLFQTLERHDGKK